MTQTFAGPRGPIRLAGALIALTLLLPASAFAGAEFLAKPGADECFTQLGGPHPAGPPCPEGSVEKNSHSYAWGMTKNGSKVFIGSTKNLLCASRLRRASLFDNPPQPWDNAYACEYGLSPYVPPLPPNLGDFRPPTAYMYDTSDQSFVELTRQIPADTLEYYLWLTTSGLRSAGTKGDVVLFSGFNLLLQGENFFAFRVSDGSFLGAAWQSQFVQTRKWLQASDGNLYMTTGKRRRGGEVLKWTGSAGNPFQFELVGKLDAAGANLTEHQGRLYVATMPSSFDTNFLGITPHAGLYRGPALPLDSGDQNGWQKVWSVSDFEPDYVIGFSYGTGELASFGDWVYWGTMHGPGYSASLWALVWGLPTDPGEIAEASQKAARAIHIFRGRNLGTPSQEIQLLYGEAELYTYLPSTDWVLQPNRAGLTPLYGSSGFGNLQNLYTWVMDVFGGQLYVGTLDAGILNVINQLPPRAGAAEIEAALSTRGGGLDPFGADLWRFPNTSSPATQVNANGFGNIFNYGYRTSYSDQDGLDGDDGLYLGTANPFSIVEQGGWELWRYTP